MDDAAAISDRAAHREMIVQSAQVSKQLGQAEFTMVGEQAGPNFVALLQSVWVLFCLGEPKCPCFQGDWLISHGSQSCAAVSHGRENKSCCCSSRDS